MKVVIGHDNSQCAEAALKDLTHAGQPGKVTTDRGSPA